MRGTLEKGIIAPLFDDVLAVGVAGVEGKFSAKAIAPITITNPSAISKNGTSLDRGWVRSLTNRNSSLACS